MSSKIKVDTIENVAGSGNVSLGSGHNLVVPGDLTVDTNVLKVDASNNRVGVNITSPTHPLSVNGQIKSTGANGETVQLQTSSQYTGISFIGSDGTRDAIIDYDHTGGVMGIKAHTSAHKISMTTGGYSERLGIDADGRVIMPGQPSFCARLNSTPAMDIATVPFETVLHNIGNHYNNSNYRFTAPVAGRYYLSYSVRVNHGTSGHIIHPVFFINGNSDTTSRTIYKNDTSAQYMGATFSYIRQLSANDYVTVNMASGSSGGTMQSGQCSFTGHLLG